MTYDNWKQEAPPAVMYYEIEDEPERCELCECDATDSVDLDPLSNPGRYMVRLCKECAAFERARINRNIREGLHIDTE